MYKIKSIEIDEVDPFKNDLLNRESFADNLNAIIDKIDQSFVMSINSSWGTGKTTFLKMWKRKLEIEDNYKTLYFNAWDCDDSEDPLLAMISSLEGLIDNNEERNKFKDVIKYAKPLIKASVPIATKLLTHGLIDISNIDLDKNVEASLIEIAEKTGDLEYESYKAKNKYRNLLSSALEEYQKKFDKRIIFFIDELDRCRPSFAIELLERIKHLFAIEGYVFVLAMDDQQLASSVNSIYGERLDSEGYLKRFVDFEFSIPNPKMMEFMKYRIANSTFCEIVPENRELWKFFRTLLEFKNVSLRDIHKLFNFLNILMPISNFNVGENKTLKNDYDFVYSVIYSVFSVMKIVDSNLFNKFLDRDYVVDDFETYIESFRILDDDYISEDAIRVLTTTLELNLKFDDEQKDEYKFSDYGYPNLYINSLFDRWTGRHKLIEQIAFVANIQIN